MTLWRKNSIWIIVLALAIIFASASCQKLKISQLRSNYHFNNANKFFGDGSYRKAIAEYEKALKFNPERVEAFRFLGESYKSLYRPGSDAPGNQELAEKALTTLNRALEIDPANKDIIYSLGDMYDRLKNFDQAEKMYLRILELEPSNMNNYYVIAEFYKRYAGEKPELQEKIKDMYLRRIESDPENVQGYAYMANYYDNLPVGTFQNKFDDALQFHQKRMELDPKNAEVYYTIGVNRFQKAYQLQNVLSREEKERCNAESEKMLLKAIEVDPNSPDAYVYMRMLYMNVTIKLYPERETRLQAEAERWGEKYQEIRKRQLDRLKLEKELKKTD